VPKIGAIAPSTGGREPHARYLNRRNDGGTRRKRRDRQRRLTGNLEARFEHRSNLQLANKFSVAKSIEQYHREDNQKKVEQWC
jgi:hypothetical protein